MAFSEFTKKEIKEVFEDFKEQRKWIERRGSQRKAKNLWIERN